MEGMVSEKYGIENLKPIVALALEMGNVGDQIGRAKGAARYLELMDLFDELMGLAKVDFLKVQQEVQDLDATERAELHAFMKVKFDIVDNKLEMAIEEGLKIVEEAYGLVARSINLAKGLKKA